MKKSKTEKSTRGMEHPARRSVDLDRPQIINVHNYRVFVSTWNVGGESPPSNLNLDEWLHSSPPADIYVLGFQEIVPLNAGNILGVEDTGPAKKWIALIGKTLNSSPGTSGDSPTTSFSPVTNGGYAPMEYGYRMPKNSTYCLAASKQMVGIFLTVWMRSDLREHVRNMKISCVGRGLMGYLRNKGSISISMQFHQTSFCFVCTHLTSGQKKGDELRRNSDVMEILKKTRFPQVNGAGEEKSPETILEHDRVIWLGDLNYRIALSYRSAKALVEMQNWRALLGNDQLRIEQRRGRVFVGWKEGKIFFPPTYKYSRNSDMYAGEDIQPKEKRRTPAWCDRILWHGRGFQQLSYVRGESRFSDHRPVFSIFWVEVESVHSRLRKMSCSSSRIEVEELLPYAHGYTELCF